MVVVLVVVPPLWCWSDVYRTHTRHSCCVPLGFTAGVVSLSSSYSVALQGGAMYNEGTMTEMHDCTFSTNTAVR